MDRNPQDDARALVAAREHMVHEQLLRRGINDDRVLQAMAKDAVADRLAKLRKQRAAIENLLRACIGLPPENNMLLECKIRDRRMFEQSKGQHH